MGLEQVVRSMKQLITTNFIHLNYMVIRRYELCATVYYGILATWCINLYANAQCIVFRFCK